MYRQFVLATPSLYVATAISDTSREHVYVCVCMQMRNKIEYEYVCTGADVTVHPVDQTNIEPGSDVSFSVTATGTAPLSYQWQKGGVDLTDEGSITGVTTATLTITGVMESDEGGYRCVVSNIAGMDTSNTAMLTVGKYVAKS